MLAKATLVMDLEAAVTFKFITPMAVMPKQWVLFVELFEKIMLAMFDNIGSQTVIH